MMMMMVHVSQHRYTGRHPSCFLEKRRSTYFRYLTVLDWTSFSVLFFFLTAFFYVRTMQLTLFHYTTLFLGIKNGWQHYWFSCLCFHPKYFSRDDCACSRHLSSCSRQLAFAFDGFLTCAMCFWIIILHYIT